jgi:hypothetical protein
MRESKWRSVSIMDLNLTKRRSGGGAMAGFGRNSAGLGGGVVASAMPISTAGQSYELIKSTQVSPDPKCDSFNGTSLNVCDGRRDLLYTSGTCTQTNPLESCKCCI